jgi:peptidoglycan/LPS O-acetylase OafA/YrhL
LRQRFSNDPSVERHTSIYLDLIRFSAAFVVFVGHVSGARFTGGFLWQFGAYMAPAVTIFFVLSGFVIAFVTQHRETDAASYAVNRMARIGSVGLPAIALTLLLDTVGRAVSPQLYSIQQGYTPDYLLLQIVTALTFTQQLWWSKLTIGSDLPYWSLNYEVFYYILFGLAVFCRGRLLRPALLALVALVGGPPILMLFPLWLLGFAAFRLQPQRHLGRVAGWLLFAGSIAAFGVYEAWSWRNGRLFATLGPESRPEIVQDYLVALLFVANLIGVRVIGPDIAGVARWVERPARRLAAMTFSLYLFHLPVAQFLAAINPLPASHPASRVLILGGTLALVALLARYTELRKDLWRRWIVAGLARLSPPQPAAGVL